MPDEIWTVIREELSDLPDAATLRSSTWETLNGPAVPLGKQPSVITRDFSIFLLIGDPTSPTGQFFEVRTFTVALPRT